MPSFVSLSVQHGQEEEESEKGEILDFSMKFVFLKNVENWISDFASKNGASYFFSVDLSFFDLFLCKFVEKTKI